MNRLPTDEYVAELLRERWGARVPWHEATAKPPPAPVPSALAEDDLTKARRRRILNAALDDAPQGYRRWQRTA
jgi:hypothetical protein